MAFIYMFLFVICIFYVIFWGTLTCFLNLDFYLKSPHLYPCKKLITVIYIYIYCERFYYLGALIIANIQKFLGFCERFFSKRKLSLFDKSQVTWWYSHKVVMDSTHVPKYCTYIIIVLQQMFIIVHNIVLFIILFKWVR